MYSVTTNKQVQGSDTLNQQNINSTSMTFHDSQNDFSIYSHHDSILKSESKETFYSSGKNAEAGCKEEVDEPEPHLANWEKWLKIHKKQQNVLSGKLVRPPQCLVMNSSLNNLYVNQDKKLIAEALNFHYCDKNRGPLNFWTTDDTVTSDGKVGVYQTVQRKYDRSLLKTSEIDQYCKPDQKEYVAVPDGIFQEKGINEEPCLPTPQQNWDRSEYLSRKKEDLKQKLEYIQEHKPDLSTVMIVGTSTPSHTHKLSNTSSEFLEDPEHISQESKSIPSNLDCKDQVETECMVQVSIGDKLVENVSDLWTVSFNDCFVNELYEVSMTIRNPNYSSFRYCWEQVLPTWITSNMPLKRLKIQNKHFFFDKTNGVILPESEVKLVFYFLSPVAGVFSEKWELKTSSAPDNWKSKFVTLQAVAVESFDNLDSIKAIDSYLDSCTKNMIVRKSVKEILDRSRPDRPQELPYDWKFFEEQIFKYNNPDLFYDNKCILRLKHLQERIGEGPWDYSVKDLRKKLIQKCSNQDMSTELEEYASIVCQLMKPNYPTCLPNEKYKSVYELLCCFINQIEQESYNLMFIYKIPLKTNSFDEVEINSQQFSAKSISFKTRFQRKKTVSDKSLRSKTSRYGSDLDIIMEAKKNDSSVSSSYNSKFSSITSKYEKNRRKQEYLEAFYIKTYSFLSHTVCQIAAVIDSFDNQSKKTVLNALKEKSYNTITD